VRSHASKGMHWGDLVLRPTEASRTPTVSGEGCVSRIVNTRREMGFKGVRRLPDVAILTIFLSHGGRGALCSSWSVLIREGR